MVPVRGAWLRHVPHKADPLAPADPPADGRWQRGQVVGALYLADEEETVWAEWYRALAENGLPPDRGLPRDLWSYAVDLDGIVDLSSQNALKAVGLALPRPTSREWPDFQRVGERKWRAGARGIIYPSAARPGHRALCIFHNRAQPLEIIPEPPPKVQSSAPPVPRGLTA